MVGLLDGDCQNAANLLDGSWLSMLHQPHGRTGNFTSSHPDLTYPQWEQIRTQQQGRHHLEPDERVIATSILGGLHHEYALERSAA